MANVLLVANSQSARLEALLADTDHSVQAVESAAVATEVGSLLSFDAFIVCMNTSDEAVTTTAVIAAKTKTSPVLVVLSQSDARQFVQHSNHFADFVLAEHVDVELNLRIDNLLIQQAKETQPDVITYQALSLNTATYQVHVHDRPLDMTYMEYELLYHFVTNPGRVHTREALLNKVWGYEYYGGARTVDVHVRRLRAKLGDEHAQLISTVRSVGYCFGGAGDSLDLEAGAVGQSADDNG